MTINLHGSAYWFLIPWAIFIFGVVAYRYQKADSPWGEFWILIFEVPVAIVFFGLGLLALMAVDLWVK